MAVLIPPKLIGIHFTFVTKIPGDILLKKMAAELPSTQQIFSETSRLVLLKNASSAVVKNGYTTWPFSLGRGVKQGDPLSPHLFIIALEILALRTRSDNQIQGFKIGQETVKLSSFAVDMTCLLKDKLSNIAMFKILKPFEELSGLK